MVLPDPAISAPIIEFYPSQGGAGRTGKVGQIQWMGMDLDDPVFLSDARQGAHAFIQW